ncbi:MAG: hypothetical protein Q9167_006581, partial [Letrouitia subvulpina]
SMSNSIESVFVTAGQPPPAPQPQLQNTTTTSSQPALIQQQQEVVAPPHTAIPETNIAVTVTDIFSIAHGPRVHVFFQDERGGVMEYTINRGPGPVGGEQGGAEWGGRDVPID